MTTCDTELDRIKQILFLINWSVQIMADLATLLDKITQLEAKGALDDTAAKASALIVTNAVGLLQALSAIIADLKAQLGSGSAITQAQIDAADTAATNALASLGASATTEAAADATLTAATTANTPPP